MVNRVRLLDILGDNAISFVAWLDTADPHAKLIKGFMELSDTVDLENKMFQTAIIPLLESKGLVDTFVKDRIQAEIDKAYSRHSFIN